MYWAVGLQAKASVSTSGGKVELNPSKKANHHTNKILWSIIGDAST